MMRILMLGLLLAPLMAAEPVWADRLTLQAAILRALQHNPQLRAKALDPEAAATAVDVHRSRYDPRLQVEASRGAVNAQLAGPPGTTGTADTTSLGASVVGELPTGTTVSVGVSSHKGPNPWAYQAWTDAVYAETRAGVTVTQALLRGASLSANLADIRQAGLDTQISSYEVRAFAMALVADVERWYWNRALADQEVAIIESSLQISQQHVADIRVMISAGLLSDVDLVAAEAEQARQESALINARALRDGAGISLALLLGLTQEQAGAAGLRTSDAPFVPAPDTTPVDDHVALGMKLRPDLNQAKLLRKRNELSIVKTRNGMLPQLDLVFSAGRTGYADSMQGSAHGDDARGWDASVGLRLSHPVGNRSAEAEDRRARIEQKQVDLALENLGLLIDADIRLAVLDVGRTRSQIEAQVNSERLFKEKARIEHERLAAGRTTTINVSQADRDYLQARLDHVRSVTHLLIAVTNLHRLEGSLLERRGINVLGRSGEME